MAITHIPEIICLRAEVGPYAGHIEVFVNGKYHSSHLTIVDAHDRMRDIKAAYEQHRQHDQKEATR